MISISLFADDVSNFGNGERLLIGGWRRIAMGRGDCPLIAREFGEACGDDAAEVYITLCTFLRALAYASRRRMVIGLPGSFGLTPNERQILALVAAAQAEETALIEAHLCWLARAEARHVLAIGTGALAAALTANNLHLPLPLALRIPIAQQARIYGRENPLQPR